MIKCKLCKVSIFKKMLHRTNPKGQSDAGWMCLSCMEKKEGELCRNYIADPGNAAVEEVEQFILEKNN